MPIQITIDPITRIEGHLKIEATIDDGVVKDARSSGMLFRGLELILKGREPRDAQMITLRVCGVCPTAHATASTLNLDSAFGIADQIPDNGRITRNLIFGSNFIQSHILHFYHLTALDFVDVAAVADYQGPDAGMQSLAEFLGRGELGTFTTCYTGDYRFDQATNRELARHYLEALEARRLAQEMLAIFGGKMPHNCTIVPGGVTENPTVDKITGFLWRLNRLRHFIDTTYIPDVIAVARAYPDYFEIGAGPGNYLAYGTFELDGANPDYTSRKRLTAQGALENLTTLHTLDPARITESVAHSWLKEDTPRHPSQGQTLPAPDKTAGYSWIKSPRYDGQVYEVGPLARMLVSYAAGRDKIVSMVDGLLTELNAEPAALNSTLGRHAARALEAKLVADSMADWILELQPGEPVCAHYQVPESARGMGITDAPRGALGHWIEIEEGKIANYQLVVPTTWNASPRDEWEQPGPLEQALIGTKVKDTESPCELVRIVRSFDPCLACSVHAIDARGHLRGITTVE